MEFCEQIQMIRQSLQSEDVQKKVAARRREDARQMTIKQSQNPGFAKALKQYYGIYDTVND
jgi:hypothetical protein